MNDDFSFRCLTQRRDGAMLEFKLTRLARCKYLLTSYKTVRGATGQLVKQFHDRGILPSC
jgi:hypothetical protein